jgi:RNA polymerase sigma factor for flagellar operon FliA
VGESSKRRKLTEAESERLVTQYAPLVKAIAQSLLRKLPPSVQLDELVQDGFIGLLGGLLQATKIHAGRQFDSYLAQRVRGAMLDGLRENDPGTRAIRRDMRRVETAIRSLLHALGRSPNEGEVADALDMPLADYQRLLQEAHGYTLFSLEDFDEDDDSGKFVDWCANTSSDPLAALERKVLQRSLLMAISDLAEREEAVMVGYYVNGLGMRQIGERLGVSEGRISQIHSQVIAKLRAAVLLADAGPSPLAPRWRAC